MATAAVRRSSGTFARGGLSLVKAGGNAVDHFLNRSTQAHADIDVLLLRRDHRLASCWRRGIAGRPTRRAVCGPGRWRKPCHRTYATLAPRNSRYPVAATTDAGWERRRDVAIATRRLDRKASDRKWAGSVRMAFLAWRSRSGFFTKPSNRDPRMNWTFPPTCRTSPLLNSRGSWALLKRHTTRGTRGSSAPMRTVRSRPERVIQISSRLRQASWLRGTRHAHGRHT